MAAPHPDMDDPPDYRETGPNCRACGSPGPHQTSWQSGQIILLDNGQNDMVDGPGLPGWLSRNCIRCGHAWPERTIDDPRPTT
jgi:L-lactate utilization protein LutB